MILADDFWQTIETVPLAIVTVLPLSVSVTSGPLVPPPGILFAKAGRAAASRPHHQYTAFLRDRFKGLLPTLYRIPTSFTSAVLAMSGLSQLMSEEYGGSRDACPTVASGWCRSSGGRPVDWTRPALAENCAASEGWSRGPESDHFHCVCKRRTWLVRATNVLNQHWQRKNAAKKNPSVDKFLSLESEATG